MELPVKLYEKTIGTCTLDDVGLYWSIRCKCDIISDKVERLYVGEKKLGVLEKEADNLTLKRVISKSSYPELPPENGYFTLYPQKEELPQTQDDTLEEPEEELWEGEILGHRLKGKRDGDYILFPYDEMQPCPCEPLMCFFRVSDGYWKIPLAPNVSEEE